MKPLASSASSLCAPRACGWSSIRANELLVNARGSSGSGHHRRRIPCEATHYCQIRVAAPPRYTPHYSARPIRALLGSARPRAMAARAAARKNSPKAPRLRPPIGGVPIPAREARALPACPGSPHFGRPSQSASNSARSCLRGPTIDPSFARSRLQGVPQNNPRIDLAHHASVAGDGLRRPRWILSHNESRRRRTRHRSARDTPPGSRRPRG